MGGLEIRKQVLKGSENRSPQALSLHLEAEKAEKQEVSRREHLFLLLSFHPPFLPHISSIRCSLI